MPSISGRTKSLSWRREASIMALQRWRVRDNLPNSWLIASLSSEPLLLANAAAICFTWTTAPAWNPPKVSTAKGRNSRPSWRQASSVSLSFRWTALLREAPGSTAPSTFEAANGLVTVTSIAASLPFDHRHEFTHLEELCIIISISDKGKLFQKFGKHLAGKMIRPVSQADCAVLAEIYNHYILNTTITFEVKASGLHLNI